LPIIRIISNSTISVKMFGKSGSARFADLADQAGQCSVRGERLNAPGDEVCGGAVAWIADVAEPGVG
jgi:hypothetical protein